MRCQVSIFFAMLHAFGAGGRPSNQGFWDGAGKSSPEAEGHPVSGDECARVRYSQCGDTGPDPTAGCSGVGYCQEAPHEGGTGWI